METIMILVKQVLMMVVLVAIGYLMYKGKKISLEGSKTLGNILIFLSLPAVIINGFLIERTPEHIQGLMYSAISAAVLLLIAIVVSKLIFKKDAIAAFAGSFSNPGFFAVPIITAMFGSGVVFYVASFIAFLNLLQWTYGVALLTNDGPDKKALSELISVKKVVTAPFMIAIFIGLCFFITGIQMPEIPAKVLSTVAGVNTPLAMFTVGVYLAQTDIAKMFTRTSNYLISGVRLLLVPAISLAVLSLVPESMFELKMALLLASACPVGSNIAVYAQLHNKDYPYAVETVVISTLLSIVSIPLIAYIATMIW